MTKSWYKLMCLIGFFSASSQAFASSCGSEMFGAAPEMNNPPFYVLEKDGRKSLLLGTAIDPLPLTLLPSFIRDAIAQAPAIAYDNPNIHHLVAQTMIMEVADAIAGPTRPSLVSELKPKWGELYKQLMTYLIVPAVVTSRPDFASLSQEEFEAISERMFSEFMDRVSPAYAIMQVLTASRMATEAMRSESAAGTPTDEEIAAVKQAIETGGDETHSLLYQILHHAKARPHQRFELESQSVAAKLLEHSDKIEYLEQVLALAEHSIEEARQGRFTTATYADGDLEAVLRNNQDFGRFAPELYAGVHSERVSKWMPLIEDMHRTQLAPLFLIPYDRLVDGGGVLNQLKARHFKVTRVVTPEAWERLKP